MPKLLLATAAALAIVTGSAKAVEMNDLAKVAVTFLLYDKDCAPINADVKRTMIQVLPSLNQRDVERATLTFSLMETNQGKAIVCRTLAPEIERLTGVWLKQ